jgi:hypothetical protein
VSDLLLRRASPSRAGAEGADDYDVIGGDGLVIGRIFKATQAPAGTPWIVDARLRPAPGPHADTRIRADEGGRDAGIRKELAARELAQCPMDGCDS